jgi:hypothetical protein
MTKKRDYIFAGMAFVTGSFGAFPYFMQPPMKLHESPWQVGILQAVMFITAGFFLARATRS